MGKVSQKFPMSNGNQIIAYETPILNSWADSILFNDNNLVGVSPNLRWDNSLERLQIAMSTPGEAKINVKSPGVLSSDKIFNVYNSNQSFPIFEINGSGSSIFRSNTFNSIGNYVQIHNKTTYDARISLTSNNNVTASISLDMTGMSNFNNGLNIYNPGIASAATAKINNIIRGGLGAYGPSHGFNWAIVSTDTEYFHHSQRAMYLSHTKSLALFDGTPSPNTHLDIIDCFEMYSAKYNDPITLNSYSIPHFKLGNGDEVQLMKQESIVVSDLLENLGLIDDSLRYVVETTGTILFDKPREYSTATTPTTGNITNDLTDAKKGIIQKIYHNNTTAPTYPTGWVNLSGAYVPNVLNIIYCCWAGGTRVEYWIVQG